MNQVDVEHAVPLRFPGRATLRVFMSWPAAGSSTASASSSSRATASSPSPTPSGTCLWRWLLPCTTTPSGNTSTRPPVPTTTSGCDQPHPRCPPLNEAAATAKQVYAADGRELFTGFLWPTEATFTAVLYGFWWRGWVGGWALEHFVFW